MKVIYIQTFTTSSTHDYKTKKLSEKIYTRNCMFPKCKRKSPLWRHMITTYNTLRFSNGFKWRPLQRFNLLHFQIFHDTRMITTKLNQRIILRCSRFPGKVKQKPNKIAMSMSPAYLHRFVYKLLSLVPMTEMD
jgi:hypothetical protein